MELFISQSDPHQIFTKITKEKSLSNGTVFSQSDQADQIP